MFAKKFTKDIHTAEATLLWFEGLTGLHSSIYDTGNTLFIPLYSSPINIIQLIWMKLVIGELYKCIFPVSYVWGCMSVSTLNHSSVWRQQCECLFGFSEFRCKYYLGIAFHWKWILPSPSSSQPSLISLITYYMYERSIDWYTGQKNTKTKRDTYGYFLNFQQTKKLLIDETN